MARESREADMMKVESYKSTDGIDVESVSTGTGSKASSAGQRSRALTTKATARSQAPVFSVSLDAIAGGSDSENDVLRTPARV